VNDLVVLDDNQSESDTEENFISKLHRMNNQELRYFNLTMANITKIKEFFGVINIKDELALNNKILNNISKLSKSKFKFHFNQFFKNIFLTM
jgi:hypothetical protein